MASDDKPGEGKAARIVIAEFDAWIQESGELFDTTHEDLAKENDIYDEKAVYEPLPLMIGKERLFPGLEKSMGEAEVGKEYEILLPPEQAAGPRDPKIVELLPMREFLKNEIVPEVGKQVTIKNKTGYISAVTAGRVRVDFNNRLAGKTLKYKYKIVSEPDKPEEIAKAVLRMSYGDSEGFEMNFEEEKAIIKLPDVCKYDQRWLLSKIRVVGDLREMLNLDKVQFIEEYAKPEEKEEKTEEPSSAEEEQEASEDEGESGGEV